MVSIKLGGVRRSAPNLVWAAAHKRQCTHPCPFAEILPHTCGASSWQSARDPWRGIYAHSAQEVFSPPANDVRYRANARFTEPGGAGSLAYEERRCGEVKATEAGFVWTMLSAR